VTDEEAQARPTGRNSLLERLLPRVDQLGDDGQPRPTRMDRREQLVAVGLGLANIAIATVSAAVIDRQQALALLAGLLASAVTLVGARVGNRVVALLGLFLSVVTRSSSTATFLTFGLPYYGAAMWMFLRYNKLVKAQGVLRRQQRAEKTGPVTTDRRSGRGRGQGNPAKARPTASKRYTPPKPVKKRPPPPSKPPRDRSPVD